MRQLRGALRVSMCGSWKGRVGQRGARVYVRRVRSQLDACFASSVAAGVAVLLSERHVACVIDDPQVSRFLSFYVLNCFCCSSYLRVSQRVAGSKWNVRFGRRRDRRLSLVSICRGGGGGGAQARKVLAAVRVALVFECGGGRGGTGNGAGIRLGRPLPEQQRGCLGGEQPGPARRRRRRPAAKASPSVRQR